MAAASSQPTEKIRFDTEQLDVIHDLWVWLSALLEQVFNPLMFVCAVYLILAYSLNPNSSGGFFDFSLGVLVAAPEFILCGAFIKSSELREQKNSKGVMLTFISWCFLALTMVTVASLVYKLNPDVVKNLVVARIGVGVVYGLVSMTAAMEKRKKKRQQLATEQSIPELFIPYLQQLQQSNQQILDQMRQENQTTLQQFSQSNQAACASLIEAALKEINQSNQATRDSLISLVHAETSDLHQTIQTALNEALDQLDEVCTARTNKGLEALMARFQRTVSVTVEAPANSSFKALSQRAESLTGLANQTTSVEDQTGNTAANQTGKLPKGSKNQTADQTGKSDPLAGLVGGASERAEAYISDCLSKEIRPSITDVMSGAGVSRDTAIKARNRLGLGAKA